MFLKVLLELGSFYKIATCSQFKRGEMAFTKSVHVAGCSICCTERWSFAAGRGMPSVKTAPGAGDITLLLMDLLEATKK